MPKKKRDVHCLGERRHLSKAAWLTEHTQFTTGWFLCMPAYFLLYTLSTQLAKLVSSDSCYTFRKLRGVFRQAKRQNHEVLWSRNSFLSFREGKFAPKLELLIRI